MAHVHVAKMVARGAEASRVAAAPTRVTCLRWFIASSSFPEALPAHGPCRTLRPVRSWARTARAADARGGGHRLGHRRPPGEALRAAGPLRPQGRPPVALSAAGHPPP